MEQELTYSQRFEKRKSYRMLDKGQSVEDFWVIKSVTRGGHNNQFLSIQLQDQTGIMNARLWPDKSKKEQVVSVETEKKFVVGSIIYIKGEIDIWATPSGEKVKQIKIGFFACNKKLSIQDKQELFPCCPRNPELLLTGLKLELDRIKNRGIRQAVEKFLSDQDFMDKFCIWPAAESFHHAYKHGLLEHTADMVKLANVVCDMWPCYNRDLIVAGCFFQDIGKIYELEIGENWIISYTKNGNKIGHISKGFYEFMKHSESLEHLSEDDRENIGHIILSHHGKKEYGSPVECKTPESYVVYFCDQMSSQDGTFSREISLIDEPTAIYVHRNKTTMYFEPDVQQLPRWEEQNKSILENSNSNSDVPKQNDNKKVNEPIAIIKQVSSNGHSKRESKESFNSVFG